MAETASIKAFRDRHAKKKKEGEQKVSEGGVLLKKMAVDGATGSRILGHNGFIAAVYAAVMFVVAYAALQLAFYGVAFLAGSTGAYQMSTQADVLTVYVIIAMVCGFDMFFAFQIEKALIGAMKARFWRRDRASGGIDKGQAYKKRHGASE